ncbi:hypothetical protein [Persicobacter psychrovividus]|uniref:Uncharacterized protein n=1 Tax=Persicobacter psychrovividus TaxID=387638 RepID=A0ABM7VDV3_9BACT|nr:hypothetical protein PEPS_13850 [Persicobacter psychrovividus]
MASLPQTFQYLNTKISFTEEGIQLIDRAILVKLSSLFCGIANLILSVVSINRLTPKEDIAWFLVNCFLFLASASLIYLGITRSTKAQITWEEVEALDYRKRLSTHSLKIKLKGFQSRMFHLGSVNIGLKDFVNSEEVKEGLSQ